MPAELRFRVMGTDAHIVGIGGPPSGLRRARRALVALDRRWSRFRDDSEISRLNASAGRPVILPDDTFEIVSLAVAAWRRTDGWFDPTVHEAVTATGYDRTFDALEGASAQTASGGGRPTAGCSEVELDSALRAVTLPPGVALDLGGIGKGHAADIVTRSLLDAGFDGACVNLGGDLTASGRGPAGGAWVIAVDDPYRPDQDLAIVALARGAVATSSRLARSWSTADGRAHHLIDPLTGRPSGSPIVSATVVAGTAADAEVLATAAVVAGAGPAAPLLAAAGTAAILVDRRAEVTTVGPVDDFVVGGPVRAARVA